MILLIKKNLPIATGWLGRAVIIGCGLLNTRLLMDLVGVDGYAAFSIVMSLGPWLALFNFGTPNALQNQIAQQRAKGQNSKQLESTAINSACTAGVLSLPLALLLATGVDRFLLLDHGNLSLISVTALIWALTVLGLTSIFHQVMHARHLSSWPMAAPAIQSALTTILLIAALSLSEPQSTWRGLWVALATAIPILSIFILTAAIVGARISLRLNFTILLSLLNSSRGFLLFGLIGTITLSCDYIIMSRILTSTEIAQYNLVSKVFGTTLTLYGVILVATWTSLSDRFFQGSYNSMRKLVARLLTIGLLLLLLTALPLVVGIDAIVAILSGDKVNSLPVELSVGWLIYIGIRIWTDTFATALLSGNQTNTVNRYIPLQAVISLSAQFVFGAYLGPAGIVWGMVFSFVLTAAWILPFHFLSLTKLGSTSK